MEYLEIREFGEIITGKTPKTDMLEYWGGDVPFITPTDIPSFDTKYLHSTERTISDSGVAKQKNTLLPAETLCVSCIATIGKMCLTRKPSITNQQINSIKVNDRFNPHYLLYLFRYYLPYLQLIGGGTGSGTPIISKGKFSKLKYPVHQDFTIQKKIANFLSTYDELIENNNKRIKLLEQIAENLYKEWFVRFRFPNHENTEFENGIPKGWEIKRIGDIARVKSGFAFKSEWWTDEGVPVIKIKDIQNNTIDFSDLSRVSEENTANAKQFFVVEGDLLIAMTGATIGKLALVPHSDEKLVVNQRVGKFFCGDTPINKVAFLYYTLQQNWVQELIAMIAGSNAAQPNISPFDIEKIKVLYNKEVVNLFNEKVSTILEQLLLLRKTNKNLIKQRDLLLPRLMSGKLEV